MKNEIENIDKIVQEAFDGFEANVDSSVWANVQSSIGSSAASSASAGAAGKSIALKIVAGAIALGTVATGTYFISENGDEEEIVAEVISAESDVEEKEVEKFFEENTSEEIVEDQTVVSEVVEIIEKEEKSHTTLDQKVNAQSDDKDFAVVAKDKAEEAVVAIEADASESEVEQNIIAAKSKSNPTNNTIVEKETRIELSVNINVDNIKGKAPLTVQFDAFGEGAETYFWDFRDGSEKINGDSPIHTFEKEGTYRVVLSGIDKMGNTRDAYKTIVVEKDYSSSLQQLPNVFSPNGDGWNDFIKIRGKNIKRIQVQIYDMKGGLVYTMNSLEDVWDGNDQSGNKLMQGQYRMVVMAIGLDGQKHVEKQVINLRD